MAADFTIGEYSFQVSNLKVKTSLLVFKKLAKTLLPAMAAAHAAPAGSVGDAFQRVAENLDSLDDLLDAFLPVTKYTGPGRETFTDVKPLVEHVFGGRPDMLIEYIARCVQGEYGAFLSGNGPLASFMAKAGLGAMAAPND
jgi:hypothetical protein